MFSMRKVLVRTAKVVQHLHLEPAGLRLFTIAPAKLSGQSGRFDWVLVGGSGPKVSTSLPGSSGRPGPETYVFCSKFVFCRKLILRTFKVQWYIQTIANLKTIVDHCPQNFENHRKTIDTNGWALKKHSMVMVQRCQNH